MIKALAKSFSAKAIAAPSTPMMELVCQADSLPALKTVIDNGADCVHLDYEDAAADLSFHRAGMSKGIRYAHDKGCKVLLALNMTSRPSAWEKQRAIIDRAAQSGVDAMIFSDPALLLYASAQYPGLDLHFSLSDAAISAETINAFHRRYGVSRILLPRVVTLARLAEISKETSAELEVFGFGRQCSIIAGRATGLAANETPPSTRPARAHSGGALLGTNPQNASVGLCGGGAAAANGSCYATQAASGVGALTVLPQLTKIGVCAIKVETRGPALSDMAQMTRIWREAIDICLRDPRHYWLKSSWLAEFNKSSGRPASAAESRFKHADAARKQT